MNDEVSVAELLVREGWGDRSGPGQSRWRVLAVMLAVVVGCGAAAVLVGLGGKGRQDASPVDQMQVIPFPQRTTGLGGADQATDSPPDGGTGGGDVVPAAGGHRATVTEVPGRTPTTSTETSSSDTPAPTTTPTSGVPGTSGAPTPTTTPPRGHQPPPAPTTTTSLTCVLIICW